MKTIKESIIGRRASADNNLCLMYSVGEDFRSAEKILSPESKIYPNGFGSTPVLYCVDIITIISFFKKIKKFQNEDSRLFIINPEYMKDSEEVKNFVAHKSPYTLFTHKELTIMPDPDLDTILAWQKSK